MRGRRGFGLLGIAMALILLGLVAFTVTNFARDSQRRQRAETLQSHAADLETQMSEAIQSRVSLGHTLAANPTLAPCFVAPGCDLTTARALDLRSATNQALVSARRTDAGADCTATPNVPGCRWSTAARVRALDCAGVCVPRYFEIETELRYIGDGAKLAPRLARFPVHRDFWTGASTKGRCGPHEVLIGFETDGRLVCRAIKEIFATYLPECPTDQFLAGVDDNGPVCRAVSP